MPEDDTQDTGDKPEDKPTDKPDTGDEVAKWKALARKHEQQAKANADAAKRLADMEESQKTETQKLADAQAAAEQRAADAEARALRLEVAHEKGLTAAQARRLVGATREELEADADELLDTFRPSETDRKPPGKPQERLRGGTDPDEPIEETDPAKLAAAVPRRHF